MSRLHGMALTSAIVLSLGGPALATDYDASRTTPTGPVSQTGTLPDTGDVSITGTVSRVINNDEFEMSYGGGMIRVDTNDAWPNLFKRDANTAATQLKSGDRVTVRGKMDNNLFTRREIDAYSLHHEQNGQIFSYEPSRAAAKTKE